MAQYLLGMYLEHETATGVLGGYIVDAEAYLGPDDEAAQLWLEKTPRLQAMYDKTRHDLFIYYAHAFNFKYGDTRTRQTTRVMIRAIEPVEGVDKMIENRQGRQGVELTNGPGKLVAALGIDKQLYGQSIFLVRYGSCQKTKISEKIEALPRIGIPNKGRWTELPLRYVVAGNPYISKQKEQQ